LEFGDEIGTGVDESPCSRLLEQKFRRFIAEKNKLSSNNESPYNPPLAKGGYKMPEWFSHKVRQVGKGFILIIFPLFFSSSRFNFFLCFDRQKGNTDPPPGLGLVEGTSLP